MIYLDNAATTKPYDVVIQKALKYLQNDFFNPSALYRGGLDSANEIKTAKQTILKSLCATNHEVVFTSCGSESDNTTIFSSRCGILVSTEGEHSAVYKTFLELKQRGREIFFAPLNPDGSVNTAVLFDFLEKNKVDFVSVMHVNNETGAINDVNKIAKRVKEIKKDTIFHSDGVQAFGKIPYRLAPEIDLYSISAHKINAPKGVGALIKKKNSVVVPLIYGGGQENGLRSGTENVFGIKAFQYATELHYDELKDNYDKVSKLNELVRNGLDCELFNILSSKNASPYILSVSAKGIRGEVLMHALEQKDVIVGNGSACSSKNRFSRVIKACGYGDEILDGVIRISFSPENTEEEINDAVSLINQTAKELKEKLGK